MLVFFLHSGSEESSSEESPDEEEEEENEENKGDSGPILSQYCSLFPDFLLKLIK